MSGVQSLVSCIFMSAAFGAMVNMNQVVPSTLGVRSVFYREQASAMYAPFAYQLSNFCVELPWLAGILLVANAVGYFMFGLVPNGFFFHYFAGLVLATVYVSIGMAVANTVPTFEVGQAVLGLLGPLFFLFGGLWSPPPQMAAGAQWFCWIDPITYAFRALIPQQFFSGDGSPGVPSVLLQGSTPPCPIVNNVALSAIPCSALAAQGYSCASGTTVPCGGGAQPGGLVLLNGQYLFNVDRYTYVSQKYDVDFNTEMLNVGYLAIFILVFQALAMVSIYRVRHIVR